VKGLVMYKTVYLTYLHQKTDTMIPINQVSTCQTNSTNFNWNHLTQTKST